MRYLVTVAATFALLLATAPATTQPLEAHPWRGYARVCVIVGEDLACGNFRTDDVFDTQSQCVAETRRRVDAAIAAVIAEYPRATAAAQVGCALDRTVYDTSV